MAKQLGKKLKLHRERQNLFQRQVAALLDIDTPLLSKIERGERVAKKEVISKLAIILKVDEDELLTLWLADQVFEVVKDEDFANEALKSVSLTINSNKKGK